MKFLKLHKKIFLISIVILIVSEIFVFFTFRNIAIRSIYVTAHDYLSFRVEEFKVLIAEKIGGKNVPSIKNDPLLHSYFKDLTRQYQATIFLLSPNGALLLGDDKGSVIKPIKELSFHKNFYYTYIRDNNLNILYMHIPISFPNNRTGALIALFDQKDVKIVGSAEDLITKQFFYYLIGMGVGVALLLIPSSILITQPLQKLRRSAQRLAKGEFSHRAIIEQKDEIGDLAYTFNKMAYTIEKMITGTKELTANISHELRSPLARIQIARDIIQEKLVKIDPDEPFEEIEEIELEIELMNQMIGKILLLTKLDTEGIVKKRENIDIVELTVETANRFVVPAKRKSIEFKIEKAPTPSYIYANIEEIRIALSNLLDNAVKYTPIGGAIEIFILTSSGRVEVSIENTCNRIPAQSLERLFELFYRPSDQDDSGSGLGLAIVKKIIENQGGEVKISQREDGIAFKIWFDISI